ncbi:hypothetical protein EDB81DRAFT_912717 [Dactylonectria macrodidyma]|uniref:Uncharacterized protein n=1 Tax=Dactylonectria macrodidyma TaxID=307937 RepID=A0A9P9DSA8_9HYPO|nr:hypothetical protein EDB81DRAFT_912717 [Dactylonectria macrodidyma]
MHGQWSWNALTSYIQDTKTLEELLLSSLFAACGQSPRLRDLLSLQSENSTSAARGIFIWNDFVIYVLPHHKAKNSTDREFYIRLYCRENGSGILTRIARQHRDLYSSSLTHEVNARVYRQLVIGITEKHVREAHSPINQYDDRSLDADLNVAFAWQGGHRPLQRGITYGLDGAYPHQLQPALLRAYEWASTRWHEFIHQPSKKVPCERKPTSPSNNSRGQKRRSSMSLLNQLNSPQGGSKKRQKTSTTSMVVLPSLTGQSSLIDQHHSSLHLEGLVSIIHQYHILVFCSGWSFADAWEVKLPQNFSKAIPELPVYAGYSLLEDEKRRIGTAVNGRGEHMAGISGRGLLVPSG